jgi:6-phosphofructokinase 1
MASSESTTQMKVVHGDAGYILEDVPHLSDYVPNLPVFFSLFLGISSVTFSIAFIYDSLTVDFCLNFL